MTTPAPSSPSTQSTPSTPSQSSSDSGGGAASSSTSNGGGTGGTSSETSTPSGSEEQYQFLDEIFGPSTDGFETAAPASSPAAPATEGTPQPAQQTAPSQQPPAPSEPAKQPPASEQQGTQPPADAGPQAASPQFDLADPMVLANALVQHEQAAIEDLAQRAFRLEDKDLEALETDVRTAIPKLLARSVVMSQQMMLAQMARIVPAMLQKQTEAVQRHSQNEDKFYQAWPQLKKSEHSGVVRELAIRYRKMFPQNTLDQMIQQLGPLVLTHLGLPASAQPAAAGVAPTNGRTVSPQPQGIPPGFQPASPGTVVQAQQNEGGAWDYMGR
jgi:hypothetical protein